MVGGVLDICTVMAHSRDANGTAHKFSTGDFHGKAILRVLPPAQHDQIFYVGSGARYRPFVPPVRVKWVKFTAEHPVFEVEIVRWFEDQEAAQQFEVEEILRLQPVANSKSKVARAISESRSRGRGPMQVNACLRCEKEWVLPPGVGRALRCGVCGSPYWDQERKKGVSNGNASVVQHESGGAGIRGGDADAVSVLQKAAGAKKRVRAVQPMRDKLAGRGGSVEGSENRPVPGSGEAGAHQGHRVSPHGERQWCITCCCFIGDEG